MPEGERDAFEDRWVEDSALYRELRDAEAELLDAYARGALSAADRASVAKYLLDAPVQRRKLVFAQRLVDTFPPLVRPSTRWSTIAAAAAIVLLAGAVSWLAWQNAAMRRELAAAAHVP